MTTFLSIDAVLLSLFIFSPSQAIDKDGSGYITVGELRKLGNMDSVKTEALMEKLDRQQILTDDLNRFILTI